MKKIAFNFFTVIFPVLTLIQLWFSGSLQKGLLKNDINAGALLVNLIYYILYFFMLYLFIYKKIQVSVLSIIVACAEILVVCIITIFGNFLFLRQLFLENILLSCYNIAALISIYLLMLISGMKIKKS